MASLKRASVSLLCATAAFPAWATAAHAQDSEQGTGLAEVVVTARRIEESLQRTPVAVTAIGSEAIRQSQIHDASGLQRMAPSVALATGSPGGGGFVFASIRGSGNLNAGSANDPAVGTYLDGVYIARPSQGLTELNDIERVEVLRGPQGTLFGRNTTGGAINIITAQPTGEFGGAVHGEYGNYDYRSAGFVLNVPLHGDDLAARLVYNYSAHDGYAFNQTLGHEMNDRKSHSVRGKIRYAPGDAPWSLTLSGDYNKITDHGLFTGLVDYDARPNSNLQVLSSRAGISGNLSPFLHNKNRWYTATNNIFIGDPLNRRPSDSLVAYGMSAVMEADLGAVKLRSISAFRYSDAGGVSDLDATPLFILATEARYYSRAYSEEFQVLGDLGERISYIAGIYYSTEKGGESGNAQSFGFLGSPLFLNDATTKNISTGLFVQSYYKLTDRLRLTGGLRWTWDTRQVVLKNLSNWLNPASCLVTRDVPGVCAETKKAKFNYPAWTAGIDFQAADDVFLYAKTSGAAKAGGWNLTQGALPSFRPEKVKDIEAGLKASWLDNRLRTNVALFHAWQSDVQRQAAAVVGTTPTQFLRNSGDARVYGAEFEVEAAPWEGMTITGNLGLLRGGYRDGSFTEVQTVPVAAAPGCSPGVQAGTSLCLVDRSGETFSQLPKVQFNIGATQKFPTSLGELSIHADYAYISSQVFNQVTAAAQQPADVKALYAATNRANRISGYGLINGRIELQMNEPNVSIYAFGRNLAGRKYLTRAFGDLLGGLGVALGYIGEPRTYGVGLTYKFGAEGG